MRHPLLLAYLFALLMAVSPRAQADDAPAGGQQANSDEEARVHFRLGTAYYESGRFPQAAQEYKRAHELSGRPELLYNLFLAYRDAGDIALAAEALRRYLAEAPDVPERSKLEARLVALDKIVAEQPPATEVHAEPESDATHESQAQPVAEAPPAPVVPERRLTWLPYSLLGAGVAMVAGGVVVGTLASNDEQQLEDKCPSERKCTLTSAQVDALQSSGSTKAVVGDALWISGAVTAALGLTFVFWRPWDDHGEQVPQARVDLDCGVSGCRTVFTRHF